MSTKTSKSATTKREKIFMRYELEDYRTATALADEKTTPLNKAIEELETIIKKPIEAYKAFSKDILGYSIEAIKKAYPKPFQLDLDLETTLKMLSIDLTNLKRYADQFDVNTECTIVDGYAKTEINQEQFNKYCETPEQFERYDYAMQVIDTIKKAVSYVPVFTLQSLAVQFRRFIECNYDTNGEIIIFLRVEFVVTGN